MDEVPTGAAALAGALGLLGYGAFSVRLIAAGCLKRGWRDPGFALLAAVLASAGWSGITLARTPLPGIPPEAMVWADVLRYGCWFWFLLRLLAADGGVVRRLPDAALAAAAVLSVLAALLTPLLPAAAGDPWPLRLALMAAMGLPLVGLVIVEQLYRRLRRDDRWGAKPLCLALAGLCAYDVFIHSQAVLFGRFDADAFAIRPGVHALAVPLLLMSTRRQADWRTALQVSHGAAFFSATLLLSGAYLLFVSGIGYYVRLFGGSWGRAMQLALLSGALLFLGMLVLSGELRARLRVFVAKHFFAYRYDYREQWLRFTALLSAPASPQQMGSQVVQGLAELVESPGGSLWLRAEDEAAFVEATRTRRLAGIDRIAADTSLLEFLQHHEWIVDIAEARAHPERYDGLKLPAELADDAWAAVPMMVGGRLTGFVLLASPRAALELDWEVRDLLKTAARQAAAFLALLESAEALLEARKFEAFNRMSAFVVHDLKNIVTQLSLMVKNAQRLHDNPEFQQDMLMTVESSLEKMRRLMLQLREGATPPGGPVGVDLLPIARRIAESAARRGRTLELSQVERVSTRGHEERIERVLGHLVQNAFDATPADGRVWLEVARVSGQVRVLVGDTGQGMTREFVELQLFKPFSSTKPTGMGIGTYESAQYVRELGGSIDVDSDPGRGTVVTVWLPLIEAHQERGLHLAATP
jgi:putative PEP-CTERM system histidine kinase